MFDHDYHLSTGVKSALVSIVCPNFQEHSNKDETERSLFELRELLRTLDVKTGPEFIQNKKNPEPATILGSGKLKEIAKEAKDADCELLVFDFELTASQIRNIKKLTGLAVVDRVHVILEIFAKHARTKDAKIQIEIARLQYLLPRLSGFWTHLGRQRGGVGVRGGEGEQQIELDRRIIRDRIEHYKKEIKDLEKSREQQKKKRQNQAVTAALVGYTNAGKSSLMNRLCQVKVLEEDKLFATLDSTFRMLNPDTKPPMILIDTVGFISNLPNTLIEGFKTTLESAMEADLLIIVCDISDSNFEKHLEVTNQVLKELEVDDKDKIIVFNKSDLLDDKIKEKIIRRAYPHSFVISSLNPQDVKKVREHIVEYFLSQQEHYDLFVPYEKGNIHAAVNGKTNIINSQLHEKGIFYRIRIPEFLFHQLRVGDYILGPEDPRLKEWDYFQNAPLRK